MAVPTPSFTIAHQKVELDVNFNQLLTGKTEITIYPDSRDLKEIRLHGRICAIKKVLVNNIPPPSVRHEDPCDQLTLHSKSTSHQHHLLAEKLARSVGPDPEPDIIITLPKKLIIQPVEVAEVHTQASGSIQIPEPSTAGPSVTEATQALSDTTVARFTPLTLAIEFETCHARETLQFVAGKRGSGRWPHVYTRSRLGCGGASPLFPCVDLINSRCTWDISIKCPRTVGDALNQALSLDLSKLNIDPSSQEARQSYEGKEMVVVCSGELTDEIMDRGDNTQKTVSFSCSQQLAPQQVGFAIGLLSGSTWVSCAIRKKSKNSVVMRWRCWLTVYLGEQKRPRTPVYLWRKPWILSSTNTSPVRSGHIRCALSRTSLQTYPFSQVCRCAAQDSCTQRMSLIRLKK